MSSEGCRERLCLGWRLGGGVEGGGGKWREVVEKFLVVQHANNLVDRHKKQIAFRTCLFLL